MSSTTFVYCKDIFLTALYSSNSEANAYQRNKCFEKYVPSLLPEEGLSRKSSTEIRIEHDLLILEVRINVACAVGSGELRYAPRRSIRIP